MKTATPKENAQTNCYQEQQGKIIALWPPKKVSVKRRKITREMVLEDAFTYHIPMEVTRILKYASGDCYPVCPRCSMPIEREYMSFCDRCGQKLGWKKLKDAVVVYSSCSSATKKDKSVTFLYFKYIYPVKQARRRRFGKRSVRETNKGSADQEGVYTADASK